MIYFHITFKIPISNSIYFHPAAHRLEYKCTKATNRCGKIHRDTDIKLNIRHGGAVGDESICHSISMNICFKITSHRGMIADV